MTTTARVADLPDRRADRARRVAAVLRRELLHGAAPGDLIPAEDDLVAGFGVSRNTIREALDLLRQEGLLERRPGVGTLVAGRKYSHGLDELAGLAETLHEHGAVTNEVRAASLVQPPAAVVSRLGLGPGEPVVYVERRRLLDGVPLSLDQTYLVHDLGEQVLAEDLGGNDIFALLERLAGRSLGDAHVVLEAVPADRHTALTLDAPPGVPLLMLERLTHLDDGRPVDLEYIRFRGDRMAMRGVARRTRTPAPISLEDHR